MPDTGPTTGQPPEFDTSVASVARVYDYLLGGKDNFAADREAAEAAIAASPGIAAAARANRAFLGRAVRYLAGEAGIRQFLDIGTGIPTAGNTHEVAQSVAPECRVVYVDNDPMVLAHARALLTSSPEGACAYIDADMHDTSNILAQAAGTLDFSRPVAITLVAVLHFAAGDDAYQITADLAAAAAPGSYLAISHIAKDMHPETMGTAIRQANALIAQQTTPRTREEVTRLFDGLDLVEPGVVALNQWRPDSELTAWSHSVGWAGIARKPG